MVGLRNKYKISKYIIEEEEIELISIRTDFNFICNEIVRKIEDYPLESNNKFDEILELISNNSITEALLKLKNDFKDIPKVILEINFFIFQFTFIDKEWKIGIVDALDFYKIYNK